MSDVPHVSDRLEKEFFQIILAVLGIIQGFALNQLAEKLSRGPDAIINSGSYLVYVHFSLAVLVLVRVFQTYLLAALDYSGWKASFFEVVSIFFVGIIQYWAFETLTRDAVFVASDFQFRLAILLAFAFLSHFLALIRIRGDVLSGGVSKYKKKLEKKIQIINSLLALVAAVLLFISSFYVSSLLLAAAISGIVALLTSLNILSSLNLTLRRQAVEPSPSEDISK